ncbi:MAG: hypothetical protein JWO67_1997 [Streptosporangiaceae bacterium]|jgi:hypothetical protein|nr:hypothetical protein [Streptosporangiaceae bacterium]
MAGCSSDHKAGNGPPVLTSTPTPTAYGMIASPLDPYMLSDKQEQTVLKASDLLARQCLRGFGIATTGPVLPLVGMNGVIRERNSRTFVDLQDAQRYGYHKSAAFLDPRASPSIRASSPTSSPAASPRPSGLSAEGEILLKGGDQPGGTALKTYQGRKVPEYGCRGEARAKLTQGLTLPSKVKSQSNGLRAAQLHVVDLRKQAIAELVKDARYRDVMKRWSTCMKQAGHVYANPRAAMRDARWRTPEATQAEIDTAVADTRCRLQVNYLGIIGSVRAAYEQRLVERDAPVLRGVRTYLDQVAANAGKALGERPLD